MNDVSQFCVRDPGEGFLQRPRRRTTFILGISVLALWFPITFAGLINLLESDSPIVLRLIPHYYVALATLLLWGLPAIPVVLFGYYGRRRSSVM
jgi:ABC-type arginine transport system permease subunit